MASPDVFETPVPDALQTRIAIIQETSFDQIPEALEKDKKPTCLYLESVSQHAS